MVKHCFAPMRVFFLSESKTGASNNKTIIVVVVAKAVHEVSRVIDESEVHAVQNEAFSKLGSLLVLGGHGLGLILLVHSTQG